MVTTYPVHFDVDFPDRPLDRLTTAFRILVAIPILVVMAVLPGESFHAGGQTAGYVASGSGLLFLPPLLMIVFRQKYPRWWFDWSLNLLRFSNRVAAYLALLESAQRHRPEAAIQGVLVSPMAKKGVEIIVGTMQDATFGPMIMVGFGGITTELFRDVIYRPAPVSAAEAAAMLAELKAAPLLNGFRGAAKADVPALAQLISQVSVLAAQYAGVISEIEINPVLVHPVGQGVTIVDALVVLKKI